MSTLYRVQGTITAPFEGYSPQVAESVGHQHTGIDEEKGWGMSWYADVDAYVYKVYKDRYPDWQAVYMLTQDEKGNWYELVKGHFRHVMAVQGTEVKRGDAIGLEGNAGQVYSGGRHITDEEKENGSQDGDHAHCGVRPVRRTLSISRGEHYLRNVDGTRYRDMDGYYYEIVNRDNGTKGWIDPLAYSNASSRLALNVYNLRQQGKYVKAAMVGAIRKFVKSFGE